ncbi:phosphonate metabolism transcriptional regulator PhnF [Pandoraea terrae]|uniref:Phosphonate metabolism transcriptional regulator PhnF n=1 Tax=Pandoraea terrae TaxID=1537710 RepID=A0A5E4WHN3_9BURK|nr:phosphonate metabolism transcriptional regulator PhnF [Pandoraea terrae]VVE22545.1 phosphonate metabolism transcriptional regulator PhnF [Pandoraea terrae]
MTTQLERGAGVAVWRQIAQILATEIGERRYGEGQPDDRLPSETDLAGRFGVNRHTVRRAILGLAEQGLVNVEHGRGTFVQAGAIDYVIGRRTRFSENLEQHNLKATQQILSVRKGAAEPIVARALGLRAGAQVFRVEILRRSVSDDGGIGVPLAYSHNYFPARRFAELEAAFRRSETISAMLAAHGVTDYTRKESRIGARLPDAEMARYLAINRQQPVLTVESVDVDDVGAPVKYGVAYFAADRMQLVVQGEPS